METWKPLTGLHHRKTLSSSLFQCMSMPSGSGLQPPSCTYTAPPVSTPRARHASRARRRGQVGSDGRTALKVPSQGFVALHVGARKKAARGRGGAEEEVKRGG